MNGQHHPPGSVCVSIVVTNAHTKTITLLVEPWGDEFEMKPNDVLSIIIRAATSEPVPIIYGAESITVIGWQGSIAEVRREGELLN